MILLCGIPTESPLAMVRDQLRELSVPYIMLNQRSFEQSYLEYRIVSGNVSGLLNLSNGEYRLQDITGVYSRLMDSRFLPEVIKEQPNSAKYQYCESFHYTLWSWLDIAPVRVINRRRSMESNFSKPYQMQLIANQGFKVPETLVTNSPDLVLKFLEKHQDIIFKSISSTRSIVKLLAKDDIQRLDDIRWCPTQFQEYIEGTNVRVHVIGDEVFATAIESNGVDYRYSKKDDGISKLEETTLSSELTVKCVKLAKSMGLAFAGIDLKFTPDNRIFCFEVNPSPAFSYYEEGAGQPIANAVARYLADGIQST
ncbi:MAG: ATP-grasp domain-containing protein [Candidatus Thorarchaeota archaeon]